jgi:hypothetical protein
MSRKNIRVRAGKSQSVFIETLSSEGLPILSWSNQPLLTFLNAAQNGSTVVKRSVGPAKGIY